MLDRKTKVPVIPEPLEPRSRPFSGEEQLEPLVVVPSPKSEPGLINIGHYHEGQPCAFFTVNDKIGIDDVAWVLVDEFGYHAYGSSGTARWLSERGIACQSSDALTGFTELLGGRVKSIHPAIEAGVLATDSADDEADLRAYGFPRFRIMFAGLYDVEAAIRNGLPLPEVIKAIDIGGVLHLRATAKNFHSIAVVFDPADYSRVIEDLRANGGMVSLKLRLELARKAFSHTARYDGLIAERLATVHL